MLLREMPLRQGVRGLLDEIEVWCAHSIETALFPGANEERDVLAAIGKVGGRYYLFGHQDTVLNDEIVAHELLHLQLCKEGWPEFVEGKKEGKLWDQEVKLSSCLLSMLEHCEVRPRMMRMGLNPRLELEGVARSSSLQLLRKGRLGIQYHAKLRTAAAAMLVANSLLFPYLEEDAGELREYAANNHPRIFEKSEELLDLLGSPPTVAATSIKGQLQKSSTILGLKKNILVPDRSCRRGLP